LYAPRGLAYPADWSHDGHFLLVGTLDPKTKTDVWVLPVTGDNKAAFPYLNGDSNEIGPRVSPDGQWLAYASDETGKYEVYVKTFTGNASEKRGTWPVSTAGGTRPVWSRNGKELFFIAPDLKMMAVDVSSNGSTFVAGAPKPLFDSQASGDPFGNFDVSADGRFLIPARVQRTDTPITVVLNWQAGLKK
jgi:Tol biopolymer transport system component